MWVIIAATLRFLLLFLIIKVILSLFTGGRKPKEGSVSQEKQKRFKTKNEDIVDADYEEIDNNKK